MKLSNPTNKQSGWANSRTIFLKLLPCATPNSMYVIGSALPTTLAA